MELLSRAFSFAVKAAFAASLVATPVAVLLRPAWLDALDMIGCVMAVSYMAAFALSFAAAAAVLWLRRRR